MTLEEYNAAVKIMIIPETPEKPDPRGGFAGDQTFWLHTYGMAAFKRPELEMRQVPGLFLSHAGSMLNAWAFHSIERAEIKEGENIMDESGIVPLVLTTIESEDPWYSTRGLKALRITPVGILFECVHPHHDPQLLH